MIDKYVDVVRKRVDWEKRREEVIKMQLPSPQVILSSIKQSTPQVESDKGKGAASKNPKLKKKQDKEEKKEGKDKKYEPKDAKKGKEGETLCHVSGVIRAV